MKTDLLVTWPTHCDYPLYRKFIADNRHRFSKVIVSFSETPGLNFRPFVMRYLTDYGTTFVDNSINLKGDWRNNAVNSGLKQSNGDFVWFTEQDFYPRKGFFDAVRNETHDVFGVYQQSRLHPCSIFMKREILENMPKEFGANPPEYDHFGFVQKWLKKQEIEVGKLPEHTYFHYNGLSHNWSLVVSGMPANYQPGIFHAWLRQSLECGVELHPQWQEIAIHALKIYS